MEGGREGGREAGRAGRRAGGGRGGRAGGWKTECDDVSASLRHPLLLNPSTPLSEEPFEWGSPDLPQLMQFCFEKFGWKEDYTKQIMDPVIERIENAVCVCLFVDVGRGPGWGAFDSGHSMVGLLRRCQRHARQKERERERRKKG